jgi:urease accessory protein
MNLMAAIAGALILLIAYPSTAAAHLVTTGLGPFYDGALHLLLSPEDLLGLVAAVALAGLQGAKAGRIAVITIATAWLVFSFVSLNLTVGFDFPWLNIFSIIILGALVAVNPTLPPAVVALLAGLYGALHGLLNGSALAAMDSGLLSIVGVSVTVLIIGLLCSALIVSLKAAWTRIAVRVAGSWIAAVGMLMLGWMVRGSG